MAKNIIEAYRNVCMEFKGLQAYKTLAHNRLKAAHKVVYGGKAPSSAMCYVPLDKALISYNQAVDEYNETMQQLEVASSVKVQIEQIIGTMSDAEQVVILMHVEQGMDLREVADKSNYSYGHIRNVAGLLRRKDMTQSAS